MSLKGAPRDFDSTGPSVPAAVAVNRGILHCRRGEWHAGLHYLLEADKGRGELTFPGLFYSYLGVALARCERRHADAVSLCEHAVTMQFYEPENFLNLAWALMLARDKTCAMEAIQKGLAIDPNHRGLQGLHARLGVRRRPPLPFLPRDHRVNRFLGRLRHAWESRTTRSASA